MFYEIILEIYTTDSLLSEPIKENLLSNIPQNINFFIFIFIALIVISFMYFYLIAPYIKENPKKLYSKYINIRGKMQKIDKEYSDHKLSHKEYVDKQFDYAKEYQRLISVLSTYPEYKKLLEGYKLIEDTKQNIDKQKDEKIKQQLEEKNNEKRQQLIQSLFKLLFPKAENYTENEILVAIKNEGFPQDIAYTVINKIKNSGKQFSKKVIANKPEGADFLDSLFSKSKNKVFSDNFKENDIFVKIKNIQNTTKTQKKVSFDKADNFDESKETKQKGLFSRLFTKKKHTANEVKDIFKDIEKSLKEKK
jgi:hypothetical protein